MQENTLKIDMSAFKPDRMTPKERFVAMCKGKPVERVSFIPFILGFAARNTGISVADLYSNPKKSFWAQKLTEQQYGIDGVPATGYADYGAWEFGGTVKLPSSHKEQAILVTHRPVETEKQGWELKSKIQVFGPFPAYDLQTMALLLDKNDIRMRGIFKTNPKPVRYELPLSSIKGSENTLTKVARGEGMRPVPRNKRPVK